MELLVREQLCPSNKYNIKAPYTMTAEYITVHNTANDASAKSEVAYMLNNNKNTSFHVAVDDVEAIIAIPLNRTAWHAGDGANGTGNRKTIGIEICYSKSGGIRFDKAEQNAAYLIAKMLIERNWGIERVKKHQDWSGKYCLPLDCTELLTPNGWISLSDVNVGDIVAQYTDNGAIEFVKVEDVVEPYESDVICTYKLDATPDHRMWCKQSGNLKDYKWQFKTYDEIMNTTTWFNIPHSGQIDAKGINISDELLLLIAWVQGDGHYMKRKYSDGYHYLGIEFHLSKQRKINRLCELLDSAGFKYSNNKQKDGTTKIRLFGKQYVEYFEQFLDNKCFNYTLLNMDKRQFDLFSKELLIIDGSNEKGSYCTAIQQNYDVVQALCAINGIRSNQVTTGTSSALTMCDSNLTIAKTNITTRKTIVSCVTVPSGKILIRQYGQPKVVGNCPHRTLDKGWDRFINMIKENMDNLNKPKLTASGVYVVSNNNNGITAGLVTDAKNKNDVEYSWYVSIDCQNWAELEGWEAGDEWVSWKPYNYGSYIILGKARYKDSKEIVSSYTVIEYHPCIKGNCQDIIDGRFMLGVEIYENLGYVAEIQIYDCHKQAWIYGTGKCVVDDTSLWTSVELDKNNNYWALYRIYKDDILIDEKCCGFTV